MDKINALQNAANSCGIDGLKVNIKFSQDKRKKVEMFFLTLNGTCISPVLDYCNMNHFILGFTRAANLMDGNGFLMAEI